MQDNSDRGPIKWIEVSEARYHQMLSTTPLAAHTAAGFLVGEPTHRDAEGTPMFTAFVNYHGRFCQADRAITVAEFRGLVLGSDIL